VLFGSSPWKGFATVESRLTTVLSRVAAVRRYGNYLRNSSDIGNHSVHLFITNNNLNYVPRQARESVATDGLGVVVPGMEPGIW
jgi:hypothetical protein